MKKNCLFYLLFLIFLVSFYGCKMNLHEELIEFDFLKLNSYDFLNEHNIQFLYWKVNVKSKSYEKNYFTSKNKICVKVQKNVPTAICVQPIFLINEKESDFFKPCGMIYPFNFELKWEYGFLSELFNKIQKEDNFNWKKIQQVIDEKLNEKNLEKEFYNPWILNETKIIENIENHKFSKTLLNNSYCYKIPLENLKNIQTIPISSFIPENKLIHQKNEIFVLKDFDNKFLLNNEFLVVNPKSKKNFNSKISPN